MKAKEKILNAAASLINEKGFDNTTVRDICGRASVNVALINYYFRSKEKLFAEVVENRVQETRNRIDYISSTQSAAIKKLEAIVSLYIDHVLADEKFFGFVQDELRTGNRTELRKTIINSYGKNQESLREFFTEGQQQKIFKKDIDLDMLMVAFYGTLKEIMTGDALMYHILRKKDNKTKEAFDKEYRARLKNYMVQMLKALVIK